MSSSPENEYYSMHAVSLLDSAQSLKSDGVLLDFTIKVENESFRAHRMVLAAYSQYFRAMFTHDTKELQEGEFEMKDVRAYAMKECLEFMYTSKLSVNMDTVEGILRLADMLQLSKVKELCVDCLSENLNVSNCIYVLKLLEIFLHGDLRKNCIELVKCSFDEVIISLDFKQLSLADAIKYVDECRSEGESIWNATVSWIEHNEDEQDEAVLEFVKLLMSHSFPSYSVLKAMWSKEWFTKSVDAQNVVIRNIFSDISRLEDNLSTNNCNFLNQLADSYEHVTKEAKNVILSFLEENFDQVMASDEFLHYSKDDVMMLLCSEKSEYLAPERVKWDAIMKWLKHNDGNDTIFESLLRSVNFDLLSLDFIRSVIKNEPLMKKFDDSGEFLLDKSVNHKKTQKNFLAVLYEDLSLEELDLETVTWRNLPRLPSLDQPDSPRHVINLNNNVCLLNGCQLFHLLKSEKWVEKARVGHTVMSHAKVVVCDGCLYIVEEECLSRYIPEKDLWVENLSHCPVKPVYVTASEKHIYSSSSQQSNIMSYDPRTDQWTEFCTPTQNPYSGILFANSKLFALGCHDMELYDVNKKTWVQKKGWRESDVTQLKFLDINGDMAVLGMKNQREILAIYNESYDLWMTVLAQLQSSVGSQPTSKPQSISSSGVGLFGAYPQSSGSGGFSFGAMPQSSGLFGSSFSQPPSSISCNSSIFTYKPAIVSACSFMKCGL